LQTYIENLKSYVRAKFKAGRPLILASISLEKYNASSPCLSFTGYWQLGIENNNQLEFDTKRAHRSALKRFYEFREEVHFHELSTELLREYELFLLNFRVKNNKRAEKPLSYGRIHCLFKTLRAYMNRAIQEGYMETSNDPFRRFSNAKYRKVASQTTRKYLTLEEVHAIENLDIPKHLMYLEKIRDMFLLSCYTGLRYSDIVRLDKSCLQLVKEKVILSTSVCKYSINIGR
jgi:integrase